MANTTLLDLRERENEIVGRAWGMDMLTLTQLADYRLCGERTEISAMLLRLIELKSASLYQHSQQVANYSMSIAATMRLPREEIARIHLGALLHDLGHLTVPITLFSKAPYLTTRETSVYKGHCNAGANILENIPGFIDILPFIQCHHERWDGAGYPKRLKGVNIPLGARIISVANHYDRYINPCAEKWRKTRAQALKELWDQAGTAFDPDVVKAFAETLGR